MPEYCGVISDKPATGASLEKVLKEEARFDDSLLTHALENKKVEPVTDILNQVQEHSEDIEFKNSQPKWSDYFLSGFQGILDKFNLDSPIGIF